jgi:hypothetical protein
MSMLEMIRKKHREYTFAGLFKGIGEIETQRLI